MKTSSFLLAVPVFAALAMVPQGPTGPAPDDATTVISLSEMQYTTLQGTTNAVSARNVVEIRLLEDYAHGIRLELVYENGDYSLIDAQSFHLLRNNGGAREVKLVRSKVARMRFPRLP